MNLENTNNYSTNELESIRISIENMEKNNQIEVLKILRQHDEKLTLNENQYGTHINLTYLSQSVLDKLKMYVNYVSSQEKILTEVEDQKKIYKNTFFTNSPE